MPTVLHAFPGGADVDGIAAGGREGDVGDDQTEDGVAVHRIPKLDAISRHDESPADETRIDTVGKEGIPVADGELQAFRPDAFGPDESRQERIAVVGVTEQPLHGIAHTVSDAVDDVGLAEGADADDVLPLADVYPFQKDAVPLVAAAFGFRQHPVNGRPPGRYAGGVVVDGPLNGAVIIAFGDGEWFPPALTEFSVGAEGITETPVVRRIDELGEGVGRKVRCRGKIIPRPAAQRQPPGSDVVLHVVLQHEVGRAGFVPPRRVPHLFRAQYAVPLADAVEQARVMIRQFVVGEGDQAAGPQDPGPARIAYVRSGGVGADGTPVGCHFPAVDEDLHLTLRLGDGNHVAPVVRPPEVGGPHDGARTAKITVGRLVVHPLDVRQAHAQRVPGVVASPL